MAQGYNVGADIGGYVQTIFEAANVVARDNNLMASLCLGFTAQGTAIRTRSDYGTATINQIADTDDLTSQVFKPSAGETLTPYEYGAQFFITDTRMENDPFEYRTEASTELGMAFAQKVETDLLGLFSSLTGGTIASVGTAMTWNNFFSAAALLRAQNAPMPYACVIHPYQWLSLGTAVAPGISVTQTNAPDLQNAIIQNFWQGRVGGIDIYTTSNLSAGTTSAGMFSRAAIALDVRRPQRLEYERDASRRGYELNLSAIYARGVWRPKFGVLIQTAGSAPT